VGGALCPPFRRGREEIRNEASSLRDEENPAKTLQTLTPARELSLASALRELVRAGDIRVLNSRERKREVFSVLKTGDSPRFPKEKKKKKKAFWSCVEAAVTEHSSGSDLLSDRGDGF